MIRRELILLVLVSVLLPVSGQSQGMAQELVGQDSFSSDDVIAPPDGTVLVEAEMFDDFGGWVLDQQFMDLMGSPYLLAHGMGRPVADARTAVDIAKPGRYRVWVRTRDWVAPWNAPGAPGRFQLIVNGDALPTSFGTEGAAWHWQDGGTIELSGRAHLRLHDLTGFEGRCDAILLVPDRNWRPPNDLKQLTPMRYALLGMSLEPEDVGQFDLVVVGGGVAGCSAAVTAARLGLKVALVQDRPVLGGNSSSEVRVWPEGHVNLMPWPAIGDVVMELVPVKTPRAKNAQSADVFDDDRKLRVVRSEPNITLFLENRMNGARVENGAIADVTCTHVRTGRRIRLAGRWFADCTGDGALGYLAGADFEQTDRGHMGASNLWNIKCLCEDEDPLGAQLQAACEEASFPRCPWAVDLSDKPFPGRESGAKEPVADASGEPLSLGNWFWESGFNRDPINDMERIRDLNFRAIYGAWDAIKNVEKRYPAHQLNWVAYIAGKRESRRLMGDVVLTGDDLRNGRKFSDASFPCTWGIDTHFPDPRYAAGHEGDEFIADYTHGDQYRYQGPYWAPYRCLYSRNISNLFMAGRDISVTHEALGAVRVMKTTGTMGEIVGMAASLCRRYDCSPRDVYQNYWPDMRVLMEQGAGRWTVIDANHEGRWQLDGQQARVRGKQVRWDGATESLSYWRNAGDFVEWRIACDQPVTARAVAVISCATADAGGTLSLQVDGEECLQVAIPDTGGWSEFQPVDLGEVKLSEGDHSIRIVNKKPEGPLMKLRSIEIQAVPDQAGNRR